MSRRVRVNVPCASCPEDKANTPDREDLSSDGVNSGHQTETVRLGGTSVDKALGRER